jgi:hypothetical protein
LALDIPEDEAFTLALQSDESPRILASVSRVHGVHVDNVAMRGASGMVFSKLDADQFQIAPRARILRFDHLQYGGNAVPYLKDEAHAKRFARSAARQIDHIKSLYPGCCHHLYWTL